MLISVFSLSGTTKALDTLEHLIVTEKENGEAAHLACVSIASEPFIVVGSKNVHLLARSRDDLSLEVYESQEFAYAKRVGEALFGALDAMTDERRTRLLQYLMDTSYTANFELIHPDTRHIVLVCAVDV